MTDRIENLLNKKLLSFSLITAVVVIIYSNSLFAPFALDDFSSITNNYSIRDPLDVLSIWKFYTGRFVLYYTLSLNYAVNGSAVIGYHMINILIHILNGFLVFLIILFILRLKQFSGKLCGKYSSILSVLASLIFVTHPVQTNAVTYIIQRTASLAATFYFLAILFYMYYRTSDKLIYMMLTILATIIAMFTKENTITIPFMLLLLELMFFTLEVHTSWLKRTLIIFSLMLTVPIIPLVIKYHKLIGAYNQSDTGAIFKASTDMERLHYFYTQMNVIVDYIKLLLLPFNQVFDYSNDYPVSKTIWENNSYLSMAVLLAVFIYALTKLRKNKLAALGILWFFCGLAVESSFISIKDVYFEHRLYFPVAGLAIFLIGIVFNEKIIVSHGGKEDKFSVLELEGEKTFEVYTLAGSKKLFKPKYGLYYFKKPLLFFTVLAVFTCSLNSALTIKRNYIFSDSVRLWSDVAQKAPGSDRAHSVLATNLLDAYENSAIKDNSLLDRAENEFLAALRLNSMNDVAHCNFSMVYYLKGDYENAVKEAEKALEIDPSTYGYRNLAMAYKKLGRTEEALHSYLNGYRKDSKCTFILKHLADTYYELGDFVNAERYYKELIAQSTYKPETDEAKRKIEEIKEKV